MMERRESVISHHHHRHICRAADIDLVDLMKAQERPVLANERRMRPYVVVVDGSGQRDHISVKLAAAVAQKRIRINSHSLIH